MLLLFDDFYFLLCFRSELEYDVYFRLCEEYIIKVDIFEDFLK